MSIDEELAKKVFEEEQAKAQEKQERQKFDFKTALELQRQLDEREEVAAKEAHDIDWMLIFCITETMALQKKIFLCGCNKEKHAFIPMGSEIDKEVVKRSRFDLQQESSKPIEEEIFQQDDVVAEQDVKESSRTAGGRRKKSLARKRAKETLSEESAKKQNDSHMMVEKKYPLSQDTLSKMLSRRLEVDYQSEMGYELISVPSPTILAMYGHREEESSLLLYPKPLQIPWFDLRDEEVGYGIRDVWVDPTEAVEEVAPTTLEGVIAKVTELAARVNGLVEDRQFHYETARLLDQEAHVSREAWAHFVGLSLAEQLSVALGQIQALQARDQTHADNPEGADSMNNMPPRRSSATARAAAAAATPMTTAAVEQLIEARVSTNSHIKTVTQDVAYAMDWKALKKMMTVKYYPRGEIKKLEIELWNLKVKGTDVASYTLRFQELALMCGRMFHEESKEVEKYVGGLPDMIQGNVMSYQPKTMEKAIEFANDQMDQKFLTITKRQAKQKRKLEFNARNNQGHQQQNKRQNTRRAYTAGPSEKREYTGSLPLCTKCNYHHKGPCVPRCNKCKKIGHLARDCRSSSPNGNNNNHGNFGTTQNALT
ncbi:reverse transcriptase domain-containing protein [Tanacetum coccineum]